jgi:hypothetical protein
MTHPFISHTFEADPFAGLNLDIPDAIKERLRRRMAPAPWGLSVPRDLQFISRTGDARLIRKVSLPNRRRSVGLRNVCHAVRQVASEMISLGSPRTGFARDERFAGSHVQQIAMYVCHVALRLTFTDIAQGFGRDRTTVAHSCARVEDRRDEHAFDDLVGAVERVVDTVFAARERAHG